MEVDDIDLGLKVEGESINEERLSDSSNEIKEENESFKDNLNELYDGPSSIKIDKGDDNNISTNDYFKPIKLETIVNENIISLSKSEKESDELVNLASDNIASNYAEGSKWLFDVNGEVNGTTEEPMDTTSPPCSPTSSLKKANIRDVVTDVTTNCDNSNNSDGQGDSVSTRLSADEDSGDSAESINNDIKTNDCVSNENSNNIHDDNHCTNSNETYSDSSDSSQHKQDNIEQNLKHSELNSLENGAKVVNSEIDNLKISANDEESEDEVDSEEDSSEDDGSDHSEEPRADDTIVSINSDSDADDDCTRESQAIMKSQNLMLQNDNRSEIQNINDTHPSPEVHEIVSDNDECAMTNNEKENSISTETKEATLRRSSRSTKRKRYTEEENGNEESDIEEITMEDPLNSSYRKNKTIIVNDAKSLVEMAAKQMKTYQTNNQKKEPNVVIVDTNSILSGKGPLPVQSSINPIQSVTSANTQSLYQNIAACGTTVTPVGGKNTSTVKSTTQTPQSVILPSLTDDMFVVEAPSFIVPYVYEKPSIKPFREFVDVLGKELEDIRAKEENERLEKAKEEKEKKELEKKEKGELVNVSDKDDKNTKDTQEEAHEEEDDASKKKKEEKKERRRRKHYDDDASWDGESSSDSEDEVASEDEENKTVVIKEKDDSIEEIKGTFTDLAADKATAGKSDNYFDCSLGNFFINIGLNFVQEFVQNDLLKQQNRKLYREKKSGANTRATQSAIASLTKNLEFSKENNAPYKFDQKKCEFCSFKTESVLVMAHHLETPHMKNNVYKCNFCPFEIRSPHDILYHMEAEHNIRGRLERALAYHQCANCPYEDNIKGKLARHLIPCAKKFKPEFNLAPPVEWEPPAKIPKITRLRNNMIGSYQAAFNRAQVGATTLNRSAMNMSNIMPGVNSYRPRGRSPMAVKLTAAPVPGAPLVRGGVMMRHNAPPPVLMPSNYPLIQNNQTSRNAVAQQKFLPHQPSISITPLPRPPQPQPIAQNSKGTFVICEICDGYIKDLEQLRNHMQWIHKVKIHPKMIYNRPPLNCQKCQFRFFTDQGLERHLLGSHGLVTSSMQEAANKGKDAGRCPVCGRVYQWKLLNHVARDHNLTLKPAHLSYKCTVCTATFGMYKQFENHVYSAHSVVAKGVMDKTKAGQTQTNQKSNDSSLKPLKINDEITIIPQPAKPSIPKDK